jgi:hypothetical protein
LAISAASILLAEWLAWGVFGGLFMGARIIASGSLKGASKQAFP